MILLDSDVLVIDLRYLRDARYAGNRRFLDHALANRLTLGITSHTLLEIIGLSSFNIPVTDIPTLVASIPARYSLQVIPDPVGFPDYAHCRVQDVLHQMTLRMALGDAVNAVQINKFAAYANCLLTWNAKHYQGKLPIPVLTPEQWWQQHQPAP